MYSRGEFHDNKTGDWQEVKNMKVPPSSLSCCVLSGLPNMSEYIPGSSIFILNLQIKLLTNLQRVMHSSERIILIELKLNRFSLLFTLISNRFSSKLNLCFKYILLFIFFLCISCMTLYETNKILSLNFSFLFFLSLSSCELGLLNYHKIHHN